MFRATTANPNGTTTSSTTIRPPYIALCYCRKN
jgi:hypothetical protein